MQSSIDKLNSFLNNFINTLLKKKEVTESENLVTDFDFTKAKGSDESFASGSIVIPTSDILENHQTENIKEDAKKHFLETGKEIISHEIKMENIQREKQIEFRNESRHVWRGVSYFIFAIIFIVLAFLVFKYADLFINSGVKSVNKTFIIENELIYADDSRVISIEPGATKAAIKNTLLQTIYAEEVKLDKVTIVSPSYLRESVLNGKKVFISEAMRGDEVFFTFAERAPLNLRTISSDKYSLGVTNILGKNETFFAFSVTEKVSAARELSNYEASMYEDFKSLFRLRDMKDATFKNITINNHDLRALYDSDGIVMVYGFGGSKSIIFSPNVDTFEKVFEKLK